MIRMCDIYLLGAEFVKQIGQELEQLDLVIYLNLQKYKFEYFLSLYIEFLVNHK